MPIPQPWPFWLAWYAPGDPWTGGLLSCGDFAEWKDPSSWWLGMHPRDLYPFRLSLLDPLEGRPADGRRLLFRWRDRGGDWRWLQAQVAPAPPAWGAAWAGRYLVAASDATALATDRQAELEASRFWQAIEHLPVLVSAFGPGNHLEFWNREAERVTGWTRELIREAGPLRDPMIIVYPDDDYRAGILEEWSRRGNNYRDWELELTRRDGEKRTVAWSSVADEAPIPGWDSWSVGVDVTDRVRAQEALQRLMLGVAHEVRNPLFALSAMVDALEARHGEDDRLLRYAQAMRQEVARLQALMKDLVEVGRPFVPDRQPVAADQLVEEAQRTCAATCAELQVAMSVEQADRGPTLQVDPLRIHQVLRNLLENAVQHAARGGRRVDIRSRTEAGMWVCEVLDNGPGIAAADLPRIFEPLFSKREGGLGLGLAIARRFADAHGGSLRASNRDGGGALFRLALPLQAGA